tara:strand:+ start:266 stop:1753 length:1488 start_codon:yes stop_codon:yes gene_type:complete
VRYDHYQFRDSNKIWTWYYQNWCDVWPECNAPCCGYVSSGTDEDYECCDQDNASYCSTDYKNCLGDPASKHQAQAISAGYADPKSTSADAAPCEYGDAYKFLQGVSDHPTTRYYRHWGESGGGLQPLGLQHLAATIVAVFHREHWYQRYDNSLDASNAEGGSQNDRDAANCATPKWWVFSCSGCWISSDEVYRSSLASVDGVDQRAEFLRRVNAGEPVPEEWLDILEADGFLGPIKDWGQGGKLIKKQLEYYDASGEGPTALTDYYFSRPGGWTYVCYGFTASSEPLILDEWWPQITRRTSTVCDFGVGENCHTAAPIPTNNCIECVTTGYGDPATIGCNPCTIPQSMGTCTALPVIESCGFNSTSGICEIDIVVGSCRGLWVQWIQYILGKSTNTWELPYHCNMHSVPPQMFNGYLARIPTSTAAPRWSALPTAMGHDIPSTVSGAVRDGKSDYDELCCGGEGTFYWSVPDEDCPADSPNVHGCPQPPSWGPDL